MSQRLCFLIGEWCCHLLEQSRDVCVRIMSEHNVENDGFLGTIEFERKISGHKTKALASSKRVPQLFSAIVSSYADVYRDGACHKTFQHCFYEHFYVVHKINKHWHALFWC